MVRLYRLDQGSFWFDEQGSVVAAAGHLGDSVTLPLNRIIDAPSLSSVDHMGPWSAVWWAPDVHPPLYPLLLRAWSQFFGLGDYSVRCFSVLASVAAIVVFFDLAKTLAGAEAALWACAIMAVSQVQIEYAQEARDYAMWEALGLGAAAAAARLAILGPGWRRAIALVICMAAMLMTHFFALFTAMGLIVWCALYLRGRSLRQALIAAVTALVVLSPAAISLLMQLHQRQGDIGWMRESPDGHVAATFSRLLLLPAQFLNYPPPRMESICRFAAIAYILPLLFLKRPNLRAASNPAMIWCALWLWAGTLSLGALDIARGTGTLNHIRFAMPAAPAFYLIIATLPLPRWWRRVAPLAAVIGCALSIPIEYDTMWKGDWRELGNDVRQVEQPSDVIVFANGIGAWLTSPPKLYLGVEHYAKPIPCRVLLLDQPADAAIQQQLAAARHVWFVLGDGGPPLEGYLPNWHFTAVDPHRIFVGRLWRATP